MMLGEHAVLHGYRALVGAINRRITVTLVPSSDGMLRIASSLGEYCASLNCLVEHPSFRFILDAARRYVEYMPSGLELKIDSEFSADIGFGSSAAVTVATHAALYKWVFGEEPSPEKLFSTSLKTVHSVQGRGSGADLAAAVFGGCVAYTTAPDFEPVEITLPLTAVYCGYKTPTVEVISRVEEMRAEEPDTYKRIYEEIDSTVSEAIERLEQRDWSGFGEILNRNQKLMTQMGVNTPELQQIVEALQLSPEILGAKISGSGLGDCAIGVGCADLSDLDYPVYHLQITSPGIAYHA